jgi:hypothetical protein
LAIYAVVVFAVPREGVEEGRLAVGVFIAVRDAFFVLVEAGVGGHEVPERK